MDVEEVLTGYEYPVDPRQIAEVPASPRDSAKLHIYDRKSGEERFDTFLHLDRYLEPGTLLILNDTKVVPARLPCYLETGGKVDLLWIADIGANTFTALSPKTLTNGTTLTFGTQTVTVLSKKESVYTLSHTGTAAKFRAQMMKTGTTPIPPYLKHTSLSEKKLRAEYQTIFARRAGSAAAPTASLHFTKRLFAKLQRRGVRVAYVTLHVGLGTFAPLTEEHLKSGRLHEEWYEVPAATAKAILKAKREGRPVIPVGTTALRTIESAFHAPSLTPETAAGVFGALQPGEAKPERFSSKKSAYTKTPAVSGTTSLFIRPGYRFKVADGLITNFHVPRSSLMMLVAALLGRNPRHEDGRTRILKLYRHALRAGFRFYSFGDGMLIR